MPPKRKYKKRKYKKRKPRFASRRIRLETRRKIPGKSIRFLGIPWTKPRVVTGTLHAVVPAIAPKVMMVHFRMCSFLAINPVDTDQTNDTIISLGDVTDPHVTPASTSQPVGLDQWFAFFRVARVLTCKVSMKIEFTNLAAGDSVMVGFIPSRTNDSFTSTTLSWTRWCEFPRARKWLVKGFYGNTSANTDGRLASLNISYNVNILRFWKSDSFIPRHELSAFESILPHTSPTRSVFGHLLVNHTDNSLLADITYRVYFTFDWVVQMSERTDQMSVSVDA